MDGGCGEKEARSTRLKKEGNEDDEEQGEEEAEGNETASTEEEPSEAQERK